MKTRCKSWVFLFYKGCETARMCLICALLLKKCLAVCLTLCLASDARRRGRGGSGCEICGRSGCGCCVCWMVSAGAEAGCGAARAWQLCGFGILPNKSLQRKGPCMYRAIACKSSVLYIRLPCLQALGPLQEHTTFRESLVCYTSPPGGVYVLGVLPGVFVIRFVGFRGRSGRAPPGPGRPAQSTGLGCPD